MPWFADFLTAVSRYNRRSPQPLGRRILAAALSATLALGTVSPAAALASEADTEGEGTAPPGAIEGPAGGEETALEEVPGSVAGGGSEESGEGPPVEAEPQQESELPAVPAAEEVTGATTEALPEVTQPPTAEAPSAAESGPAYEPAPAPPSSEPVENQPLSAPPSADCEPEAPPEPRAEQPAPDPSPSPEPAAPSEEEPPPPQLPAVPAERQAPRSDPAGRDFHIVRSGECLWSIAAALLPAGASNAEIAAEVKRLWRLNARRIGTGDPSLLMVGTRLRLP
jgi:hypothetical protein